MNTATLGTMLGACAYLGYSFLDGGKFSMWLFFLLAGVGNIGLSFSVRAAPRRTRLRTRPARRRCCLVAKASLSLGARGTPPDRHVVDTWSWSRARHVLVTCSSRARHVLVTCSSRARHLSPRESVT
jgi:hypothetical protein